ncbi:MAG TPA: hypothetical protein VG164_03010 [Trebonia sp.]|nr:hypothetical protein [Trebonia sp.]
MKWRDNVRHDSRLRRLVSPAFSARRLTLTTRELTDTLLLVIAAGYDTTVNLIDSAVTALLAGPDQLAHVRAGRATWGDVVEETLRFATGCTSVSERRWRGRKAPPPWRASSIASRTSNWPCQRLTSSRSRASSATAMPRFPSASGRNDGDGHARLPPRFGVYVQLTTY